MSSSRHNLVIGIGGPTSSGKSTLGALLAKVLGQVTGARVTVISTDSYFVPRSSGPRKLFTPTLPADARVVDGHAVAFIGREGTALTAEDRDCLASCDWAKVKSAIRETMAGDKVCLRNRGVEGEWADDLLENIDSRTRAAINTAMEDVRAVLDSISRKSYAAEGCQSSATSKVSLASSKTAPVYGFTIVEGFLLLAKAPNVASKGAVNNTEILSRGDCSPPADVVAAHTEVIDEIDLGLFLRIDKATAKTRRFGRVAYKDPPEGIRENGQFWRTLGYFDQIAW
jgi:energy-coupling factor transporter ATP-binding protein EcfA2